MDSEKLGLPPESSTAFPTADKLVKEADIKRDAEPTHPPEAKKPATTSSTDPDAATPSPRSTPENPSGTSDAVSQNNTPLSGSSSTTEIAETSRTAAGAKNQVQSGQDESTAGPSPEPTAADEELNVLQATVCAEIKDRMPAGVDTSFSTSDQRVFVWSEIEAKQVPSKIRHIYYLNGQKVSDVSLDVRSTNWRTWSFKNVSDSRNRGEWRVDITTSGGKVLRRLYFVVQ
ncbi:DUF2914 domain-containing protein [Desulfosarcina sp.]|uniref:DUF2914 domain-containing protein n=1 Tax=Desulfosarcina sp. TaxID=2027861 RepID=UPI003564C120